LQSSQLEQAVWVITR